MNTPQSFWDLNPEVRDFAASLDAVGVNIPEIRERIRERFGDGLVPSAPQMSGLRRGILKGRWMVPAEPQPSKPSTEPAEAPKQTVRTPHFWDRIPEIRDAALALLSFENHCIVSELTRRFGTLPNGTSKRLLELRYGVLQGLWSVPEQPDLARNAREQPANGANGAAIRPDVPTKAITLLGIDWVGCKIHGVVCLSGRACLTRQLSAAKRQNARHWKVDEGHTALFPGFSQCVGCAHWLTDEELVATHEIMYGKSPPRPRHDCRRML